MLRSFTLLASFLEGIVTWVATILFLAEYPFATIAFLIGAHGFLYALFRSSWWGLVGGFFAGVVTEFITRNSLEPIAILIPAIRLVIVLQIVLVVIAYLARDVLSPESSIAQNFAFALLGALVFYVIQMQTCGIPQIRSFGSEFDVTIVHLDECGFADYFHTTSLYAPFKIEDATLDIPFAETTIRTLWNTVWLSPLSLAILLATLRQVALKKSYHYGWKAQLRHQGRQLLVYLEQSSRAFGIVMIGVAILSLFKTSSSLVGVPDLNISGQVWEFRYNYSVAIGQLGLGATRLLGMATLCYLISVILYKASSRY